MILYILTFILIALASASNAVMDTLDHHHSTSIFVNVKNPMWWNFHEGWRNKYVDRDPKKGRVKLFWKINKPVQITDAWHFFKMLMIIFMCSAIITGTLVVWFENPKWYSYIILLALFGTAWNLTFSLFYKKLLIK